MQVKGSGLSSLFNTGEHSEITQIIYWLHQLGILGLPYRLHCTKTNKMRVK